MSELSGKQFIRSFYFQTALFNFYILSFTFFADFFAWTNLMFGLLSIARLQHLFHLFRKRPSGFWVLPSHQVSGTNNLRLWMHI